MLWNIVIMIIILSIVINIVTMALLKTIPTLAPKWWEKNICSPAPEWVLKMDS